MQITAVSLLLGSLLLVASAQDQKPDAVGAIDAALSKAAAENRRVLLVWETEESEPSRRLHELFAKNEEVRQKLLYEYDVVHADAGRDADIAQRYHVDASQVPVLTVLDAKGVALANQPASALANDPQQLLAFLAQHQAPYPKAEDVRQRALADAKAAGKRLFLTFGAPW